MNKQIEQLALEAGGSHWPMVGGRNLEVTVRLAVEKCRQIAIENDDWVTADAIRDYFEDEQ